MKSRGTALTARRLSAIEFALDFVLAGDVAATLAAAPEIRTDDLQKALDWTFEQLVRRQNRTIEIEQVRKAAVR